MTQLTARGKLLSPSTWGRKVTVDLPDEDEVKRILTGARERTERYAQRYVLQSGRKQPTPRQRRRLQHKENGLLRRSTA